MAPRLSKLTSANTLRPITARFSMESPERRIINKLDGGGRGMDKLSEERTLRPSLAADTVWGPACMLSVGWGRGAAPGAAFSEAPSPVTVQPNDL